MRFSWLRMLLLGLMIGPVPLAVDAGDADAAEAERAPVAPTGHVVRGENFYVWDEDAREAASWAEELGGATAERAGGGDLGALLRGLSQLERTWLITSWATSDDEPTRCRLASALAGPIDGVGTRWVLEHLQRDPSAEVRRRARAAVELRAADGARAS